MFDWLFGKKKKEAAQHETELTAKISDKLSNYNADEDISITDFSQLNSPDNTENKASRQRAGKHVDAWGEANPSETGKWNRAERRKSDRRGSDRRK